MGDGVKGEEKGEEKGHGKWWGACLQIYFGNQVNVVHFTHRFYKVM
jgi:hypothetical protein